jgi:bifunctional glutamyl/prolyl-tRNA synthetase
MSMASVSANGSNYSAPSNSSGGSGSTGSVIKPAKLAIQTPSNKIIRLTRKTDNQSVSGRDTITLSDGTEWETVIKVGERGTWRGLVLADRSLRWCVFAEWECV